MLWGDGDAPRDHCNAHDDDPMFVQMAENALARRQARAQEPGSSVAQSDCSTAVPGMGEGIKVTSSACADAPEHA